MEIGVSFWLPFLCNATWCGQITKKMLSIVKWILPLAWVRQMWNQKLAFNSISSEMTRSDQTEFKSFNVISLCFVSSTFFSAKFDVKNDMIIKTAESRNLGAKFLDNADSLTKIECLHLCCETESCDVFVYEEKVCNVVTSCCWRVFIDTSHSSAVEGNQLM